MDIIDKDTIKSVILERLPKIAQYFFQSPAPVYLFNEHYVVKEQQSTLAFKWHTDGNEQLPLQSPSAAPYVSIWCALHDVSSLNGTIAFSEREKIDIIDCNTMNAEQEQRIENKSNLEPPTEEVGQELSLGEGSIVAFSSDTWHRSGVNLSSDSRCVFYAQYSSKVIPSFDAVNQNSRKRQRTDEEEEEGEEEKGEEYPLSFAIKCQ